jgi:formylglycine-generating enzyme required for sulfatase activity
MFCRWMSSVTGKKYRVPTEAEWELACRAGVAGAWKLDKASIEKQSWHAGNSGDMTHPVAKKAANKYGLFDMLGNVGEWATDTEGKPVLCGPTFRDPVTAVSPTVRKRWEPSWQETDPQMPKSRWWLSDGPFAGFRVVCEG